MEYHKKILSDRRPQFASKFVKDLIILRFNDLRVDQRKKPCIRVNTRELNRELCTRLSTLYTKLS